MSFGLSRHSWGLCLSIMTHGERWRHIATAFFWSLQLAPIFFFIIFFITFYGLFTTTIIIILGKSDFFIKEKRGRWMCHFGLTWLNVYTSYVSTHSFQPLHSEPFEDLLQTKTVGEGKHLFILYSLISRENWGRQTDRQ